MLSLAKTKIVEDVVKWGGNNKLIAMSKKLDIEVELTLRNSSNDVAKPMDKPITVILTGNNDDKE